MLFKKFAFTCFLLHTAPITLAGSPSSSFFDVLQNTFIDKEELLDSLKNCSVIVLGEYHYQPHLQAAQAELIGSLVSYQGQEGSFQLAWEFLNRKDQILLENLETDLKTGIISYEQFLRPLLGDYPGNSSYYPILKAVIEADGTFLAVNLSREEKRPVIEAGISALPAELLPPDFELGGANYYERFLEAFQGHTSDRIDNYFAAQSLTDDVMAYTIAENLSPDGLLFLIAGSFHTDYRDGVVSRLEARLAAQRICTTKFLASSQWDMAAIYHQRWGEIADFVIVSQEI